MKIDLIQYLFLIIFFLFFVHDYANFCLFTSIVHKYTWKFYEVYS